MIGVVAKLTIQPDKESEFEQVGKDLMAKVGFFGSILLHEDVDVRVLLGFVELIGQATWFVCLNLGHQVLADLLKFRLFARLNG